MTIFTSQERRVVLFLAASLLGGAVVKLCRSRITPDFGSSVRCIQSAAPSYDSASILELDTLIGEIGSVIRGESTPLTKKVIDINTASEGELCLLPGIGPRLANRIVGYRETHGKFKEIKDLVKVPGIGDKKLAAIRGIVAVSRGEKTMDPSRKVPDVRASER